MVDELYVKLLRYLVDPDGQTPKDVAIQVAAGRVSGELLSDFDAGSNSFQASDYSDIFDFAVDYFRTYNELITDDIIRSEITADSTLKPTHKRALIALVNRIADEDYQPTQFEYVVENLRTQYVENYSVHIFKNALKQSATTNDPVAALDYTQRAITDLKARVSPSRNKLDRSMLLWQLAELKRDEFLTTGLVVQPIARFGFPKWDALFGGMFAEEVTVLAGPKNSFKSGLMNRILIYNIHAGKRVVWATRENSIQQNWNRLVAHMTGIPLTKINLGILDDFERSVVVEAMDSLIAAKHNVLMITPQECQNAGMLRQQIQMHFGNDNPDIIGLDHIGRLKPTGRSYGQTWENIAQVTEEVKDLTSLFQTTLITPAHLNRKGNKSEGEPGLDDMQFDSISQIVDNLLICRPDLDMPWAPPEPGEYHGKPGIMNCYVARARNQPKGMTLQLEIETSTCMARDWEAPISDERPEVVAEIRRGKLRKKTDD